MDQCWRPAERCGRRSPARKLEATYTDEAQALYSELGLEGLLLAAAYESSRAGELLTAIVTPFDREGAVDYERFRELARTASRTAPTASSWPLLPASRRRSPTTSASSSSTAVDAVGDGATVIGSTGTYSTAHSVHLTERPTSSASTASSSSRRTTTSRRRGDRRALQGGRGSERQADHRLQHPAAGRDQHRAGDDRRAGRDPDRQGRQAGDRGDRPGAADRDRDGARPLRRQRPPRVPVPRGRRRRRRLRARPTPGTQ